MELVLEVISRVILMIYYLLMLLVVWRQASVRKLSNVQYIEYSNRVKELNKSQYQNEAQYRQAVIKGSVIQWGAMLWSVFVIQQGWFVVVSSIALIVSIIEISLVNQTFHPLSTFKKKDWVRLYTKRVAGIMGDCYVIIALLALICCY